MRSAMGLMVVVAGGGVVGAAAEAIVVVVVVLGRVVGRMGRREDEARVPRAAAAAR
jgi:hypothetical protein